MVRHCKQTVVKEELVKFEEEEEIVDSGLKGGR